MALLINDISVNQAQLSEIYTSYLNSRKLGEAMSLPTFVIDEVRRQIREEGLRYLKSDTTVNKTIPFTINHAKNDVRQSLKAIKADSKPVVEVIQLPRQQGKNMQQPKTNISLSDSILVLLATSKTIMQPQELNTILQVDHVKLSQCLKKLLNATLIIRTPNGRYTLSQNGEKKVARKWPNTTIHSNVYMRIERYSTNPVVKVPDTKLSPTTKADKEVGVMMSSLIAEGSSGNNELDQIEIELAKLDCAPLNAVDVKVKILHSLSNKLGGKVGAHLAELQSFISR
jgi:hypothetical protein